MKRLGLSDFLELKARRGNGEQIKEYKSEFLNGTIAVKRISPYKVTELMDKVRGNEGEESTNGLKSNIELIYKHCPDFQNGDLIKKFECSEPYDIVLKIFDNNVGAINDFSTFILSLYGMLEYKEEKGKSKIGEDIKN